MHLWTRKNRLHFGNHLPPDPDPGIFWRLLQYCEVWHFPQFDLQRWKEWSNFHENFIAHVSLDNDLPVEFWKYCGSRVRYGLRMQTRFSLAEVYGLWLLLLCEYLCNRKDACNTIGCQTRVLQRDLKEHVSLIVYTTTVNYACYYDTTCN